MKNYPFNPTDWTTVTPLFEALRDAPVSNGAFVQWLEQWNQLDIDVWDAYTYLKRPAYSDTSDQEAERVYQAYVQELFSTYLGHTQALIKKALTIQPEAPSPQYQQLWRRWHNQATLFHADSLPIQAEISRLEGQYREIMRECDQDNPLAYWIERRAELNDLMMRLLKQRRALAHVSGAANFLAYRWRELNRLDWSITDCQNFHRAVETSVVPLVAQVRDRLKESFPEIDDVDALSGGVERILGRIAPTFGEIFHAMRDGYLDIGARPNKTHTVEAWFFPRAAKSHLHVVTTNAGSVLHESGHAMHDTLSFRAHGSMWNLNGPEEFQEFVAVSMDMLAWPYYEQANGGVFTAAESTAAHRNVFGYYLESLTSDVMQDAFEHWVYGDAPEDVTPDDLDAKWLELKRRFLPWDNQYANETEEMTGWQRWTWSLFRIPLYMIAYPTAIVGTCQFARLVEADRAKAIQDYKTVLAMGNTRPLPALFRVVGLKFPFTAEMVEGAAKFIVEESRRVGE